MVSFEQESSLVILRFLPPHLAADERDYLEALKRISDQERAFVLLTMFGGGGKLSQAGEREQALWFKATRGRMDELCRAMAIVRPGATEKTVDVFRKLWAMPIALCGDEAEGRRFLAPFQAAS